MRHCLSPFILIETLANTRHKFQTPGDGFQACVLRKPLNGLQGQLLIAHILILPKFAKDATAVSKTTA